MGVKDDRALAAAEARFKKAEARSKLSEEVAAENAAKGRASDANTARLKALRLEKEQAEREAVTPPPATKPVKKPRSKSKPHARP